jgi:hypothetical protein
MMGGEVTSPPRALIGWTTMNITNGCVLKLQSTLSSHNLREGVVEEQALVMSMNQVRLLGEYLVKLADGREGKRPRKQRWWSL